MFTFPVSMISGAGGSGGYSAQGVTFDGSADYLTHTSSILTNSGIFTCSFWFRMNSLSQSWFFTIEDVGGSGNDKRLEILFDGSTGPVKIIGRTTSGSDTLEVTSSAVSDSNWHHCLMSFDLSDTGKRHLYIDDSSDLSASIYNNNQIDLSGGSTPTHHVGAQTSAASKFNGDLADFWLDSGTYIDFSVEANRRDFIDASGKPVDLGSDGSTPTASAPDIFLHGSLSDWHTNDGSGGGFTENGALTAAGSSPSD